MINVCVIIPCYNEYERFPKAEFLEYYTNSRVSFCFVNDGSRDETLNLLHNISETKERISVLNLDVNEGKAEAVRRGVLYVLENKDIDYIAYFDADLATPLSEIDNLLKEIFDGGYKFVIGSRFKHLGVNIKRTALRHYLGRVFATIASIMLNLPVYDTQCGAKLLSRDFALLAFKDKFVSKWLFDLEIFFRLKNDSLDNLKLIRELPLRQWTEKGGSKISFFYLLRVPFDLVKIYFKYK